MVDYRKIECPWCHNVLFTPISDVSIRDLNGLIVSYRETMCPDCQKKITIVENITTKFAEDVTFRLDDENDKVAPLFAELGSKYKMALDDIRRDIDERIGKLRDEWDNPEPGGEKIKLILEATDGTKIESQDELEDYIRENYDTYDLREWIDREFGTIDIGPYSFEAAEIIDNMEGSFNDIASETYECNYASDRVSDSEAIFFDEPTDPDNVDVPEDGQSIEVAGLCFTYKHIRVKKDAD